MPIDLTTIAPEARARYLHLGRQWGSPDTLAQAHQTLKGCAKHGAEIAKDGFSSKDAQRLSDARDGLIAAGVGRAEARNDRKITSQSYVASIATGKTARESARSILESTRTALHEGGTDAAKAGVKTIDAALQTTRTAGDDAEALATQLDVLRGALSDPNVGAEATDRGGPEAIPALQTAAGALRAANAERAGSPGTQVETEKLDLLDGIIVTLARNAFKAARAAAKRIGQPSLVADFELTKLYAARTEPGDAPSDGPPAPPNA